MDDLRIMAWLGVYFFSLVSLAIIVSSALIVVIESWLGLLLLLLLPIPITLIVAFLKDLGVFG